jgi:two-component system nitrogen regulation response regulator GlnG
LLYRLAVIRIIVPALRDRREDIAALADHFWQELSDRIGSRATLAASALADLSSYDWPGNVRELQNVLVSLMVASSRRDEVSHVTFGLPLSPPLRTEDRRLADARKAFDERLVRAALARAGGHRGRAARELGLTRQGLAKLIVRLDLADLRPRLEGRALGRQASCT